jgi:Arc/MetJ-type ribon-helix-helix transcriptional regulator
MDVSISKQHLENIMRKVGSGKYSSAGDVLACALALLDEREETLERELADTKEKVRQGIEQTDTGQLIPADRVFQELRQRDLNIDQNRK